MRASLLTTSLFVLAGLATGSASAAPLPSPPLAEAQLRAINHRFVDAFVVANGDFMEALTGEDFLLTRQDGTWVDRDAFIAQMRRAPARGAASYQDVQVRLFGPVAVLHGVFTAPGSGHVSNVRYTDVYAWDGAEWKLVSGQDTALGEGVAIAQHTGAAPAHAPWQGEQPRGDDLTVLRALNEQYVQAFRDADVAWYDAHLAPDYVVVSGDGSYHDRGAALADFAHPYFAEGIHSFPLDKVRIRRFGDVALIHAENAYELKDGRKGVNRYTDIWFKQDGTWRCVAAHITVHQPPT